MFIMFFSWLLLCVLLCFFSSRSRHTRSYGDWSSDVCSSDLRLRRARPFAAEATLALEQRGLLRFEAQGVAEIARRDLRRIAAVGLLERPVTDRHVGAPLGAFREPEPRARSTLIVQQPPGTRIGERRMGEQQLPRCKPA